MVGYTLNMIFPIEDIITLIPQKPPFMMVDKLLYTDESITRSSFFIDTNNVFLKEGHFLEGGLLENIAQTAALKAGYEAHAAKKPVAVGYIAAVNNFEIFALPSINDELLTEIIVENQIFDITVISGKVWCNNVLMAQCEMKVVTNAPA
jgi:predicted hotdog family 3-hydroxylacyl-ACP dehydratase